MYIIPLYSSCKICTITSFSRLIWPGMISGKHSKSKRLDRRTVPSSHCVLISGVDGEFETMKSTLASNCSSSSSECGGYSELASSVSLSHRRCWQSVWLANRSSVDRLACQLRIIDYRHYRRHSSAAAAAAADVITDRQLMPMAGALPKLVLLDRCTCKSISFFISTLPCF